MARIKKRKVKWNNNYYSTDVVGYKLYWTVGSGVDYDSDSVEVGNVTEVILPDNISSFPLLAGEIELGVTAVNHTGNESDMARFSTTFDFTVPDAPTGLEVEII